MNTRRSKIEIIGDILRLGKTIRTDITCGCDLNYYQLQRYLKYLTAEGFLELDNPSGPRLQYRPTTKGQELLNHIEKVRTILDIPDRDEAPPVMTLKRKIPA